MELKKRKPNRLRYYDYSRPGAYFITVCTKDRRCILGEPKNVTYVGAITDRPHTELMLSPYGEIVNDAIRDIPNHYNSVVVDTYVIMPNHVHLILVLLPCDGRSVIAPTVSTVIRHMKGYTSRKIGRGIWQKSFHDHIMRNKRGYDIIRAYIRDNPKTWENDRFHPTKIKPKDIPSCQK